VDNWVGVDNRGLADQEAAVAAFAPLEDVLEGLLEVLLDEDESDDVLESLDLLESLDPEPESEVEPELELSALPDPFSEDVLDDLLSERESLR
jgi:hypothetical protein